jgi:hypothetical protein
MAHLVGNQIHLPMHATLSFGIWRHGCGISCHSHPATVHQRKSQAMLQNPLVYKAHWQQKASMHIAPAPGLVCSHHFPVASLQFMTWAWVQRKVLLT